MLDATVSALAYSLASEHARGAAPELAAPYNDVARFLERQCRRLPDTLRLPIAVATLLFDGFGLVLWGAPFHRQSPEKRQRQIEIWRHARLRAWRDFIRYYESLAILALHSRIQ